MDCIASAHGILQARILEWVTFPSPGDLPDPGIKPGHCRQILYHLSHNFPVSWMLKVALFHPIGQNAVRPLPGASLSHGAPAPLDPACLPLFVCHHNGPCTHTHQVTGYLHQLHHPAAMPLSPGHPHPSFHERDKHPSCSF